ncbi:MAG: cysteine desulfurase [Caulobacter sp.]|nr:cysteine desulfurase [Caulobacter sp.]
MDPRVLSLVIEVMRDDFANPHAEEHVLGWQANAKIEAARQQVASAIGGFADEVVFTSGATEADNIGVLGAALGAPDGRRRILVSDIEHKAVLEAASAARRFGFHVDRIPVGRSGVVDPGEVAARLGPDVAVVSVMAVNNEVGTIQPIAKIAELAAAVGAFVHTDATQAPAAMDVDVAAWNVDAASFSSHKVYGPKGVGALYLSGAAPWRPAPLMVGGGQEGGMRPGTLPTPLCAGFGLAMEILAQEGAAERRRVEGLRERFVQALKDEGCALVVTCDAAPRHPGSLHILLQDTDAHSLLGRLQPTVCASTGSACNSGMMAESYVLAALGIAAVDIRTGVRFSLGRFTTEAEIAQAARVIAATRRAQLDELAPQAVPAA